MKALEKSPQGLDKTAALSAHHYVPACPESEDFHVQVGFRPTDIVEKIQTVDSCLVVRKMSAATMLAEVKPFNLKYRKIEVLGGVHIHWI